MADGVVTRSVWPQSSIEDSFSMVVYNFTFSPFTVHNEYILLVTSLSR